MVTGLLSPFEYQRRVRRHCQRCKGGSFMAVRKCKDVACDFYEVRNLTPQSEPSIFDGIRESFLRQACDAAERLGVEFWWSDLRTEIEKDFDMAYPKWWGAVANRLRAMGYVQEERRRSVCRSRKGGIEWRWRRKSVGEVKAA